MPTSYTSLLGLALPVTGELSGTWGDTVNDYITKYVDASVAGTQTISGSQTAVTLTRANGGALSQAGSGLTGSSQYQIINCTGNPAGTLTVTIDVSTGSPTLSNSTYSQTFAVINGTSTSQSVVVRATTTSGTSTGTTLVSGEKALIAWNGSDFIKVATSTADGVTTLSFGSTGLTPSTATSGAVTVAGTLVAANGGTGQSTYTTGDLLYATGSTALSKLGIGTNGQILTSTGTAPQWSTLSGVAVTTFSAGTTGFTPSSATSGAVTLAGTLATTNGGTGLTSFTANRVFYASSTSAIGQSANLTFDGTTLTAANFTDSSLTSGRVTYATTGGNLTDSANLLYSGTDLTVYGITVGRGAGAVISNTAMGLNALQANTSGASNTATGYLSLKSNTSGASNTGFGRETLQANTTGNYNNAFGDSALYANTTGANNTAVGHYALVSNTTASNNTAVGYQAGYSNTTGTYNTFIGGEAGKDATTGSGNTGIGNRALGYQSLISGNLTGADNVAVGNNALRQNTSGSYNTAVGTGIAGVTAAALQTNTTGSYNTAIGNSALGVNSTASNNTAVGYITLYSNTTGTNNTAIGVQALQNNTTASNNTAVGYQAGYSNTTGQYSALLGTQAGYSSTVSNSNVMIGYQAGYYTTGNNNVFVGTQSGTSVTTGTKNTIIGGYSGNQGGLDIRTASNYIVLSDGDGNPRMYNNGTDWYDSVGKLRAIPQSGSAKTTSYTLATTDVGEFIQISTGGSIVIPNSTFAAGDVVSLFNNTTGSITITCSTSNAYIAGTDTNKASMTLATRGVATILFVTSTLCVVSGNVT